MMESFKASELHQLPIWLLIVRIHWDELLRYRHRARRVLDTLAESLESGKVMEPPAIECSHTYDLSSS